MSNATAVISVLADTAKAQKGIATLSNKLGGLGSKFSGIGNGLAVVGGGAAAGIGAAVKMASDLQQNVGGVQAVFGKFADKVVASSNRAAKAVGLSANDYDSFATVIGSQFKNAGVPIDQLGSKTGSLIKKAADLAATFGGSTSDAVNALSSAMKGEFDPIEKYGISLNQNAINAQAAAMGAKAVNGQYSQQAKVAATLALVNKQGADAQGQFGKQTNTLAEQQQVLKAKLANVGATIGTAFLPMVSKVADTLLKLVQGPALKGFIDFLTKNPQLIIGLVGGILGLAAAFKVVGAAMRAWSTITKVAAGIQAIFNAVMAANPIAIVVLAIVALIAATVLIVTHWTQVSAFLAGVWKGISDLATSVFGAVVGFFVSTWGTITTGVTTAWDAILAFFAGLWGDAKAAFMAIVNGAVYLFENWTLLGVIISHWGQIMAFFGGLWARVSGAFQAVVSGAVGIFKGLGPAVVKVLKGAGSWLFDAGKNVVQGLLNGVRSLAGTVGRFFLNLLPGWIVGPFKAALGIRSPSKVFAQLGGYTIAGLTQGLTSGQGAIKSAMGGVSDAVTSGYATRLKTSSVGSTSSGTPVTVSQMTAADRAFFRDLFREYAGTTITDGVIASAASAAQARLVKSGAK